MLCRLSFLSFTLVLNIARCRFIRRIGGETCLQPKSSEAQAKLNLAACPIDVSAGLEKSTKQNELFMSMVKTCNYSKFNGLFHPEEAKVYLFDEICPVNHSEMCIVQAQHYQIPLMPQCWHGSENKPDFFVSYMKKWCGQTVASNFTVFQHEIGMSNSEVKVVTDEILYLTLADRSQVTSVMRSYWKMNKMDCDYYIYRLDVIEQKCIMGASK